MSTPDNIPQLSLDVLAGARAQVPSGLWEALKHREQLFVAAYLADPTMRKEAAAIAAGFKPSGAGSNGSKMLQKATVLAAVDAAVAARAARVVVDADRVLDEVDTVSLSSIEHYRLDETGNLSLAPGAPPNAMQAVASFDRTARHIPQGKGEPPIIEYTSKFKLWGKPETLRLSMQHRGMLIDRVEMKLPPGSGVLAVPVPPGDAQWAAGAEAQQRALAAIPPTAAAPSES